MEMLRHYRPEGIGKQNSPPQNMCLWHINYFKLVISKEKQPCERL